MFICFVEEEIFMFGSFIHMWRWKKKLNPNSKHRWDHLMSNINKKNIIRDNIEE